jgi:uncharacterized protein
MTVDPEDGSLNFSFAAGHATQDIDDTLERLFRMLGETAAARKRPVVLVLDEFQEIVDIDPNLTKLLRSVFQEQPEVAHIYLGSRRHLMERIFNDANEPFWRSAKRIELGPIAPDQFEPFIRSGFTDHGRDLADAVVDRVLEISGGHPYATQELCYFLWAETAERQTATAGQLDEALTKLLRSEHSHFSDAWGRANANQRALLGALAAEPGHPLAQAYRSRYGLRAASTVQRSIETLAQQELVARDNGFVRISEPFFAEWIRRNAYPRYAELRRDDRLDPAVGIDVAVGVDDRDDRLVGAMRVVDRLGEVARLAADVGHAARTSAATRSPERTAPSM